MSILKNDNRVKFVYPRSYRQLKVRGPARYIIEVMLGAQLEQEFI